MANRTPKVARRGATRHRASGLAALRSRSTIEPMDPGTEARIRAIVSSRLRRFVPGHEVEELADAAIVQATQRAIEAGACESLTGLALKIGRDLAVGWMRRSRTRIAHAPGPTG